MSNLLGTPDPVQVFLTYMMFAGDIDQTVAILQIDRSIVEGLSAAGNWPSKIKELQKLGEGKEPREYKLAVNRGVNYIQADRLRRLVDVVLTKMAGSTPEEVMDLLTTTGPKGNSFSTRPLTDLVKAAESAQLMTRLALGDVGAGELAEGSESGSDIALSVMRAMNSAAELEAPAAEIRKVLCPPLANP